MLSGAKQLSHISVIITLFNKGPYIKRAIRSVKAQDYLPDELIVVDDASTDDGAEIAARSLSRWPTSSQLIRRQSNGGGEARSSMTGLRHASGSYVAFLDADDEWDSRFLSTCIDLLRVHPDAGASGSARRTSTGEATTDLRLPPLMPDLIDLQQFVALRGRGYAPIRVPTTLYRREIIDEIGGFVHAARSANIDFIYRFFLSGQKYAYCTKSLATIHRTPLSMMEMTEVLPHRRWQWTVIDYIDHELSRDIAASDNRATLLVRDVVRHQKSSILTALRLGVLSPEFFRVLDALRHRLRHMRFLAHLAPSVQPLFAAGIERVVRIVSRIRRR